MFFSLIYPTFTKTIFHKNVTQGTALTYKDANKAISLEKSKSQKTF